MKLTYLYHSGFLLECERYYILFDYFLDGYGPNISSCDRGGLYRAIGPLCTEQLIVKDQLESLDALDITTPKDNVPGYLGSLWPKLDKPCYILCSHFHKDHFLPFVFKLYQYAKEHSLPEIKLILSHDIKKYRSKTCAPYKDEITFLNKGQSYEDELIKVQAYGSTDVGCSFALELKDEVKTIFHAGDFNYWHWQEESTFEEVAQAHEFFLAELAPIENEHSSFDVVMFPCDMRMVSDICAGAEQFVERIATKLLVPMHVIERPDLVISAVTENKLLAHAIVHYTKERCTALDLSQNLQIWLPDNSGDSCLISA